MFGRLIKWFVTVLFVAVAGIAVGLVVSIVITTVPLWGLVVAMMVVLIVLFKFVVWVIGGSDYV